MPPPHSSCFWYGLVFLPCCCREVYQGVCTLWYTQPSQHEQCRRHPFAGQQSLRQGDRERRRHRESKASENTLLPTAHIPSSTMQDHSREAQARLKQTLGPHSDPHYKSLHYQNPQTGDTSPNNAFSPHSLLARSGHGCQRAHPTPPAPRSMSRLEGRPRSRPEMRKLAWGKAFTYRIKAP